MKRKLLFIIPIIAILSIIGILNLNQRDIAYAQMGPGGFSNVSPFLRDGDAIRLRSTIDYIGTFADPIPNIIVDNLYASTTIMTDLTVDNLLVNNVTTSTELYVGDGSAASPSISFLNDIDTGLYLSGATMNFSVGGTKAWTFAETYFGNTLSGRPVLANETSTATNPNLIPNYNDLDTGIGYNPLGMVSLIDDSTEIANFASTTITHKVTTTFDGVGYFPDGIAALPSISFASDTNTGIYTDGADTFRFAFDGSSRYLFTGEVIQSASTNGFYLQRTSGSSIDPNFAFVGDTDTGIGRNSADEGSLIAGGKEMLRWDANELEIQPMATFAPGAIELTQDSGAITAINLPVSSTPSAGDIESYSFGIDSNSILTVYAEADGTGGIQNQRLGVGTTTPAYMLDVYGDVWFDGDLTVTGTSTLQNDLVIDTSLLFVDTANDKIGVGTTTPATLLDVFSTGTTTITIDSDSATQGACLKLKDSDGGGYSYITILDGTITASTVSCE